MPSFPLYPRISRSGFTSWNESMFIRYNNERVYYHPNPVIRFVEQSRVNTIIGKLRPFSRTDRILAAGCGEGFIENRIPMGKIVLMDLSAEAVRRAKASLPRSPRFKFVQGNLEKIPFADGYFDKIECSEVIEHVYSPQLMLKEFFRVLRPAGVLVISFPNEPLINFLKKILIKTGLFHIFFPNVPRDMTEEWHLRSMDLPSFRRLAGNWTILSVSGIPFSFLPIRYVITCRPLKSPA